MKGIAVPVNLVADGAADLVPTHMPVVETFDSMVLLNQAYTMMSEVRLLVQHQLPTF